MAEVPDLLEAIRAELADEEILRPAGVAGALPPLWLEPADGPPAPGEATGSGGDDTTIVSAFRTGEVPRSPGQGYSDRAIVDFRIRSKDARVGPDLVDRLSDLFAPAPLGVRHDWSMGGLQLLESRQWRPIARLGSSRAQGFEWVVAYLFELYT